MVAAEGDVVERALAAVLGIALLAAPDSFDLAITSGAADIAHFGCALQPVDAIGLR